jgi:AAA domain-containing protein
VTVLAVELVGPPGSGKSTLLAAVAAQDGRVAPVERTRAPRVLPYLLYGAATITPLLLDERPAWQQTRWIARVEAATLLIRCSAPSRMPAVVFAQGPIYSLARLAGADLVTPRMAEWRAAKSRQLATLLEAIVVLDAPDEVLLHRIRARGKAHALKRRGSGADHATVAPFRSALTATLADLTSDGGPAVLRFDTSRYSPQQMAASLLGSLRLGGHR